MQITIQIDGRQHQVEAGTSVAAAMWNCGVTSSRTSVTGQPRSALCGMGICFECRATVNGVPHERTCMIPCTQGMQITTSPLLA